MDMLFLIFVGVFGLFWGSFSNVVIYRLKHGGSLCIDRSRCPHCKHTLAALDLVPLFSWLFLKGKCRYCSKSISPQYPLVELSFGISWLLTALHFGIPETWVHCIYFLFLLFLISSLIIITVYDLLYMEIPDQVALPLIALSGLMLFHPLSISTYSAFLGAFIIFTFFYLQILIPTFLYVWKNKNWKVLATTLLSYVLFPFWILLSLFLPQKWIEKMPGFKEEEEEEEIPVWIGGGDLRLAFVMGLVLGWKNGLVALFVAYLVGAIIGVVFMYVSGGDKKSQIPFGPFLAIGTVVALFFGEVIWNSYWSFMAF